MGSSVNEGLSFRKIPVSAPRNSFRSNWDIEFSRIGSQTNGRNLIDGLNKAIKISRKLSLDAIKKCDW